VNDQEQADWARDERFGRWEPFVPGSAAKWSKDHTRPQKDDAAGKKTAFYAELLKQTAGWLEESPKSADVWWLRLEAMEHLDDAGAADVAAVSDRYLSLLESQAGPDGVDSDPYFNVARVLSEKHLQPERVLELAGKGLAQAKIEDSEPMYDGYATKDGLLESNFYNSLHPMKGSEFEVEAYIQLKQAGKARLALTRMEDELQATKALVGDKAEFKKEYTGRLATWWGLMARTAELQNHEQDAMAFYEHALIERLESQQMPETGMPDEVGENARRLFTKLGGSNDAWQIWYGSRADNLASHATLTWEDANEPLPAFALPDLTGKIWTQESLKGKVTFLNFWASW
jgi:hypothetical protein